MRIGVDLDNTIISYEAAFVSAAKDMGYLGSSRVSSRNELKAHLLKQSGGEISWQRLQGYVYGKGIGLAELYSGAIDFFRLCRARGVFVTIVSHKTLYGHFDDGGVNLRKSALGWLEGKGFFAEACLGLSPGSVYFESTRAKKISRISSLDLTHFIDDLPEVLLDQAMPKEIEKLYFSPDRDGAPAGGLSVCKSWGDVSRRCFN